MINDSAFRCNENVVTRHPTNSSAAIHQNLLRFFSAIQTCKIVNMTYSAFQSEHSLTNRSGGPHYTHNAVCVFRNNIRNLGTHILQIKTKRETIRRRRGAYGSASRTICAFSISIPWSCSSNYMQTQCTKRKLKEM